MKTLFVVYLYSNITDIFNFYLLNLATVMGEELEVSFKIFNLNFHPELPYILMILNTLP